MLKELKLTPIRLEHQAKLPRIALPLIDAISRGEDVVPIVHSTTANFGFDTFTCGVSMSIRPTDDSLVHVFTTVSREWLTLYNQHAFIEIDPRVQTLIETGLPLIWDQSTFRAKDRRTDEFLDYALQYGIASGIAVGFVDRRGHAVTVALNSQIRLLESSRIEAIADCMGDILLFAHFFEEALVATVIDQKLRPMTHGAPISRRERQCLALAANGQTGDDIAYKLGITARTVQFHFDSIRSKLGAASRQEAIAKAVQAGIVYASL